jgi:hypothetical protein
MRREPLSLKFDHEHIIVDGVPVHWNTLSDLLYLMAQPDPRKWYRFERDGDAFIWHVKIEEVPNGNHVTSSSENSGRQGQETHSARSPLAPDC